MSYRDTTNAFGDTVASWSKNVGRGYKLLSGGEGVNYFLTKAKAIRRWTTPTTNLTVTFDPDGGTMEEKTYNESKSQWEWNSCTLTSGVYQKSGLTNTTKIQDYFWASKTGKLFEGWYKDGDGEQPCVDYIDEDCTLKAKYLDAYTTTFDLQGGKWYGGGRWLGGYQTTTPTGGTVSIPESLCPVKKAADGKPLVFDGWYTVAEGGTKLTQIDSTNSTVYAHYKADYTDENYKPYTFASSNDLTDKTKGTYTFTFRPSHYSEVGNISDCTVYLACAASDWANASNGSHEAYKLTKDDASGNYSVTFSGKSASEVVGNWYGFKFIVSSGGSTSWYGFDKLTSAAQEKVSNNFAEYNGDCNFILMEANTSAYQ